MGFLSHIFSLYFGILENADDLTKPLILETAWTLLRIICDLGQPRQGCLPALTTEAFNHQLSLVH